MMNKTLRTIATISGIAYVLAWIIGLSSGGPDLPLNATGSEVIAAFVTHKTGGVMQFLFAEGVAGLTLLLLIAVTLFTLHRSGKLSLAAKVFGISGISACLISLIMAILGLILVLSTAPQGVAAHAQNLSDLINRLDGPKMWLLGTMAVSGSMTLRGLPKWFKLVSHCLAASLLVSGLSYGLLIQSLAWSVYIAGILLLVWVCAFGILLGSRKDS